MWNRCELNRKDQVTAPNSWPSFHRKTGATVDSQVAVPTDIALPVLERFVREGSPKKLEVEAQSEFHLPRTVGGR
jgi:hypothetical protein